jgi:hypothetical protein
MMLLDNNVKIISSCIQLIQQIIELIELIKKIMYIVESETFYELFNQLINLLIKANLDGYIIFITNNNDPIITNIFFSKFNINISNLYCFLNIKYINTDTLIQFLNIANVIMSSNYLLIYCIDFKIIFEILKQNNLFLLTNDQNIKINNCLNNLKNLLIVLINIQSFVSDLNNHQINDKYNHQINNKYNHQINNKYNHQINDKYNHQINDKYNNIIFSNIVILENNKKILNNFNNFLIQISDIIYSEKYSLLSNTLNNFTIDLLNYNSNGYFKFSTESTNSIRNNLYNIDLSKFNMETNIIYFFMNTSNNIDNDTLVYIMDLGTSIIFNNTYLLLYTIDLNPLINFINSKIFTIINYQNINNVYIDQIKEFNNIILGIEPLLFKLQYTKSNKIYNYQKECHNINSDTKPLLCKLQYTKSNIIKFKLYINIFIKIKNNLCKCIQLSKSINLIQDLNYYNEIPNIDYEKLPESFKYQNIEYYRKNNILYLKKNDIIYYKQKNNDYYKIINNEILIDNEKIFKHIYEIFFLNSEIIILLKEIEECINSIYDNKIIKFIKSKIYFFEINNCKLYDNKILQIIDLFDLYIINNNFLELKDIWEYYYNVLMNSSFNLQLNNLYSDINSLLIKLI